MTKKVLLSLLPIAALLISCTLNQNSDSSIQTTPGGSQDSSSAAQSSPSSSSSQDGEAGYYKAESINDNVSLRKISDTQETPILPSVGTFDVLVLPVQFTDCPFTDRALEEISIAVGEDASATNYWETLPSYYEKSSYGRLDINCTMADPVDLGMTADTFIGNANSLGYSGQDSSYVVAQAIEKGVSEYKKAHGNTSTQAFDSDQDGYIDATIVCERDSHKGIIIGRGGSMLKRIGTNARLEIEDQLGAHVNLKLFVKVRKDWRNNEGFVKSYGYDIKKLG